MSTHRFMKDGADSQGVKPFHRDSFNELAQEMLHFPLSDPQTAASGGTGKAGLRISLQDVVDAFSFQTDTLAAYINLDTGEVALVFLEYDCDEINPIRLESRKKYEACNSLMLPRPDEVNDYGIMENFVQTRNGLVSEKLQEAIQDQGAVGRFRETVMSLGISDEWYIFREEAYRVIARTFLAANELRWKEQG